MKFSGNIVPTDYQKNQVKDFILQMLQETNPIRIEKLKGIEKELIQLGFLDTDWREQFEWERMKHEPE